MMIRAGRRRTRGARAPSSCASRSCPRRATPRPHTGSCETVRVGASVLSANWARCPAPAVGVGEVARERRRRAALGVPKPRVPDRPGVVEHDCSLVTKRTLVSRCSWRTAQRAKATLNAAPRNGTAISKRKSPGSDAATEPFPKGREKKRPSSLVTELFHTRTHTPIRNLSLLSLSHTLFSIFGTRRLCHPRVRLGVLAVIGALVRRPGARRPRWVLIVRST